MSGGNKKPRPSQIKFPDPSTADENGVVGFGGDLEVETLFEAYSHGIFPWPHEGLPLLWFSPDPRAILRFDRLRIPKSLAKVMKRAPFTFSFDEDFEGVIRACSSTKRPEQRGTWITEEMIEAYLRFHQAGFAHSVEVWAGKTLVGGLYGVCIGQVFCGESMFFREPNASKLALLHLIEHLRKQGAEWMDIQVMTPHMEKLGALEVPREEYLDMLKQGMKAKSAGF